MNCKRNHTKHIFELFIIYPFVFLGKILTLGSTLNYDIYFFFPFYHTGGAEKVHSQIVNAVKNKKCIVYFTKKSINTTLLNTFKNAGCEVKDISKYTDNKWVYFFNIVYRGYIAALINRQTSPKIIFNGQCNFAYKLAPWINKTTKQIELIHSFNTFSYIRVPYLQYYTSTIMISKMKIDEHLTFYKKIKIPDFFENKILHINNAIPINKNSNNKDYTASPFIVLYVGRNSPEKRLSLIIDSANYFAKNNSNIEFHFLGIEADELNAPINCIFLGNQSDNNIIQEVYRKSHCLVLTSSTEGFPMVIIEAMANKCAIIATSVGDVPNHIKKDNGFVIDNYMDEEEVVKKVVEAINTLERDRQSLTKIGDTNYQYALEHFDIEAFNFAYQKILTF